MKKMEENSVDAVVTDPPYGLAFMGKEWDDFEPKEFQEFCEEWGEQALRVLKPGGHLLAFCGTRTYHRMVVGLEDAGFEIRDQIAWMYGSGFPKGQDISKAVDKKKGEYENREEIGENPNSRESHKDYSLDNKEDNYKADYNPVTKPSSKEAEKWQGWNTSLKPGHEPIVVAQKPKNGTYAENILKHGVGGVNIDGCRIKKNENDRFDYGIDGDEDKPSENTPCYGDRERKGFDGSQGRWPANLLLDQKAAEKLDEQAGDLPVRGSNNVKELEQTGNENTYGVFKNRKAPKTPCDSGGASRFFYTAKAQKSERNAGLEADNDIATLKPINLMRWLTRLVTPENGTVLDPFAGSGTTGCAAEIEGFDYILIEKREKFAKNIIANRLEYWSKPSNWNDLKNHNELEDSKSLKNGKITEFSQ